MPAKGFTDEFETRDVVIRDTTYKFRELSAAEYDKIIKLASGPDDNAELNVVLKLMVTQSLIDPKLTAAQLDEKPYPVYAKLLQTVNVMHFTPLVESDSKNGKDEDEPPNE